MDHRGPIPPEGLAGGTGAGGGGGGGEGGTGAGGGGGGGTGAGAFVGCGLTAVALIGCTKHPLPLSQLPNPAWHPAPHQSAPTPQ